MESQLKRENWFVSFLYCASTCVVTLTKKSLQFLGFDKFTYHRKHEGQALSYTGFAAIYPMFVACLKRKHVSGYALNILPYEEMNRGTTT